MEVKAGGVKSRWKISLEPPRKIAMNLFRPQGTPGAFWGPPAREGSWSLPGGQEGAPEASRSHFGIILGAKMEPRGFVLGAVWEHFEALFPPPPN